MAKKAGITVLKCPLPGLILKKLSRGFFLVAPTTSQKKEGSWYVEIRQEGKLMCVYTKSES